MTIHKLSVQNFKGIGEAKSFSIRPITIFLGGNSSGKSTCLHALAALSQTLKLGNTAPSLTLDDDYAHVHLGRFIEIAHSRKYSDSISLGIDIGDVKFQIPTDSPKQQIVQGSCSAEYSFKSTLRTQEVYVDSARISVGDRQTLIRRAAKAPYAFSAIDEPSKQKFAAERTGNFLFRISPLAAGATNNADLLKEWISSLFFLDMAQKLIEHELRNALYLGPFRQSPLRRYPFRGSTANEVGSQGEATITMLASEFIQAQDRPHLKQVIAWLAHLNLAKNLDLARVGTSDLFDVKLTLPDGNKLPIADLGYGLSQVLPVLTQCSFAPDNSTLLFEQPELHLHEGAARKLAHVFNETRREKNAHLILETHSRELVQEFFHLIRDDSLKTEDIAIYVVERSGGASQYKELTLTYADGYLEVDEPWLNALAK